MHRLRPAKIFLTLVVWGLAYLSLGSAFVSSQHPAELHICVLMVLDIREAMADGFLGIFITSQPILRLVWEHLHSSAADDDETERDSERMIIFLTTLLLQIRRERLFAPSSKLVPNPL
eukprot:GHVU01139751.1.p2 GENE.GHVU01139751.1~~GHVU01139751.1.p2  ORF type:complete len:118 (+),score=5.63 GHVU01139751.1:116-469(+)